MCIDTAVHKRWIDTVVRKIWLSVFKISQISFCLLFSKKKKNSNANFFEQMFGLDSFHSALLKKNKKSINQSANKVKRMMLSDREAQI